jgi:hypothetical protein
MISPSEFLRIFERKLCETPKAKPFIEGITGDIKRIRIKLGGRCLCPLEFVAGTPWSSAGDVLGMTGYASNVIIGAADDSSQDPPYTKARKRLLKICRLKVAA